MNKMSEMCKLLLTIAQITHIIKSQAQEEVVMKIDGTKIQDINQSVPGIVLLSHGPLSSGLLGSLRLISGDVDNVAAFQLEEGDDPNEFSNAFIELYEALPEKSVFLIDVFGGTPFNETLKYFLKKGTMIRAVCGVNLGMLMEACVTRENTDHDFFIDLEAIGQQCVIDVHKKWESQ